MTDTIKILHVVGARPNFMKIAPVMAAVRRWNEQGTAMLDGLFDHVPPGYSPFVRPPFPSRIQRIRLEQLLVHTGQHYDREMSQTFFGELGISEPDVNLGVGSGSHGIQTARILEAFEPVLLEERPDLVVVVGDVNSTMACTLAAAKLHIPVAHVEAGLRSLDRAMPEEVNRLVTDALARLLLVSENSGLTHLLSEGIHPGRMYYAGNVMIDTLLSRLPRADRDLPHTLGLPPGHYATMTLHRPSNVDDREHFDEILRGVENVASRIPVLFPAHPRTQSRIAEYGYDGRFIRWQQGNPASQPGIYLMPPLPYLELLALNRDAQMILTDSGGLQEEATVLGIPCLTIRENTERPSTIETGTNTLVGPHADRITDIAQSIIDGKYKKGVAPLFWDGRAAERIVAYIIEWWTSFNRHEFPCN